jgi:threonine 3-dehydrogenase
MQEGFDVGLEMSGNPHAFRDMLANMAHGGKIAMLGSPTARCHRLEHGHLLDADHQGIYGREMYETWYKMNVMLESRPRHPPGHHPPLPVHEFNQGFEVMLAGKSGRVILDWRLPRSCGVRESRTG